LGPISIERHHRLRRLRALSNLLDSSIGLPGGYRIGIEGFIGLIPGLGDSIGAVLSSYIVLEAARLGASTSALLRMMINVLIEAVVGLVPVLGDLFDFIWKANNRNVALLEKHLEQQSPRRSGPEQRLAGAAMILLVAFLAGMLLLFYAAFQLLLRLVAELS